MLYFDGLLRRVEWNAVKDRRLRQVRGKGFSDMLNMNRLREVAHPTRPTQVIILCEDQGRVWVVPSIVTEDRIFFKTLYQSRKYTAMHKRGELL